MCNISSRTISNINDKSIEIKIELQKKILIKPKKGTKVKYKQEQLEQIEIKKQDVKF